MGQRQIFLADLFGIGADIAGVGSESLRAGRERGQYDVQEIGAARKHAQRVIAPSFHHLAAMHEVVAIARFDEGKPDAVARTRRDEGHLVGKVGIALQIVQFRQRPRAAGEARIRRHVGDPFALAPHLAVVT